VSHKASATRSFGSTGTATTLSSTAGRSQVRMELMLEASLDSTSVFALLRRFWINFRRAVTFLEASKCSCDQDGIEETGLKTLLDVPFLVETRLRCLTDTTPARVEFLIEREYDRVLHLV